MLACGTTRNYGLEPQTSAYGGGLDTLPATALSVGLDQRHHLLLRLAAALDVALRSGEAGITGEFL